jgi:hypothetical protein
MVDGREGVFAACFRKTSADILFRHIFDDARDVFHHVSVAIDNHGFGCRAHNFSWIGSPESLVSIYTEKTRLFQQGETKTRSPPGALPKGFDKY